MINLSNHLQLISYSQFKIYCCACYAYLREEVNTFVDLELKDGVRSEVELNGAPSSHQPETTEVAASD